MSKSRCLSASTASGVGYLSGWLEGSSTNCAKRTARQAAKGRRAHHMWSVEGCPWRIDFSRADATLIASSGMATSMSFFVAWRFIDRSRMGTHGGMRAWAAGKRLPAQIPIELYRSAPSRRSRTCAVAHNLGEASRATPTYRRGPRWHPCARRAVTAALHHRSPPWPAPGSACLTRLCRFESSQTRASHGCRIEWSSLGGTSRTSTTGCRELRIFSESVTVLASPAR